MLKRLLLKLIISFADFSCDIIKTLRSNEIKIKNYLVIFVFVLKLGNHGDGILGLGVIDDPDVKPIERHKGNLTREFLLVHLFKNLSPDLSSKE